MTKDDVISSTITNCGMKDILEEVVEKVGNDLSGGDLEMKLILLTYGKIVSDMFFVKLKKYAKENSEPIDDETFKKFMSKINKERKDS